MKVLGKVAGLGLDEMAVAGVTKFFEEKLLASTPVGNGNIVSGGAKILIGSVIPKSNKYWNAVALGFGMDGIEDILSTLMSGNGMNLGNLFGGGSSVQEI